MEKYNYEEAVRSGAVEWLNKESQFLWKYPSKEDALMDLTYRMTESDFITNAAPNEWVAEEFLCHNMDLFIESCEWYDDYEILLRSAKKCDVQIRCYMLQRVLDSVLSDGWYGQLVESGK